jgi:hypothetical protein
VEGTVYIPSRCDSPFESLLLAQPREKKVTTWERAFPKYTLRKVRIQENEDIFGMMW